MRSMHHRLLRQSALLTLALAFAACSDADSPMRPGVQALFTTPTGLLTASPPQVFIGAGDISSCSNTGDEQTAKLLDANPVGTVYNIGDDAYDNGTTAEFACYNSTWGRHKARTKPTSGNHEYNTSGASGYYQYFGAAAHPSAVSDSAGFYSFDLGAWHILALNSNITRSLNSKQDKWLAADLAAHPNQCTLAYFHHPLYSSGGSASGQSITSMRPFWDRLYAAHADLVLNGHRHFYERMALMKPDGTADPTNGIRTIIAGMGGIGGGSTTGVFPTSQVREGATFGVLKLYLYDDSYAWKFLPVAGKTFTDSGSTACHSSGGGGGGGGGGTISATNSTVTAAPSSFTTGSGSSTITVTAKDGTGAVMSGASVSLGSTGTGNTLTPSSGTTNGSGVFTSTFTSSVAEGKTVSATINGTLINQTASVTVNPSGGGGGGGGTITPTLLTSSGDATNQRVYTTASIAHAANALVTVAVLGRSGSGPFTPSIAGGGMSTWTQVASVDFNTIATPASRLVVFRAMSGSPGNGPITITYSSSQSNAQWLVTQWTGVDPTGTNGAGAIGQTGVAQGNAVTTLNVGLAAFANNNNVGFGLAGAAVTVTPGSGFTEIGEGTSGESMVIEGEWGTNKNAIAASWASSNAGLLGLEIKAGAPGAPVVSASLSTVNASSPIAAGSGTSNITVTAKDGSGNPISGATVVLAATGSNNVLTQPVGTTALDGTITGSLTSTTAQDKQVSATINGVAITQKPNVTVTPGTPAALAYTTQPSNTAANAPISPAVVVEIRDAWNNRVNSGAGVTMDFGTNAGPGTLAGTLAQTAVNGVATFSDLAINTIANGYTLKASSTALTDAISNSFNITPPVPSASLSTVVAGTPSFTAGGSSDVTVTVKDGLGNAMSGVTVALSSTVVGDVITQPASTTDINGVTTGTVSATSAGPRTITAVAGGVTLNQKPSLTVTAGTPDAGTSTVSANPTSIVAGSGSSTITVTVRDQYSNPVTGSSVVLGATGTGNSFGQPGSLTGSNGVTTGTVSSTDPQTENVTATADGSVLITQQPALTVTNLPPPATITHALLTSGSNGVNQSAYTTASISPTANKLITVAVLDHRTPAAVSPTLSGGGMTSWSVVATVDFDTIGGALRRLTIFRAMSTSPGSGPITITFPNSVSNVQWIVSQWGGVETSGVNGAGAIVQTGSNRTNAGNGLTVNLGALGNLNNVAYGVFGVNKNVVAITPGAGFTKIDEQPSGENTPGDLLAEWVVNHSTIDATWTNLRGGALGVEIKAATGP